MRSFSERIDYHGKGIKHQIKRFSPPKKFGTGIDPLGAYNLFVKKDLVQNIDVHKNRVKKINEMNSRRPLAAVECTKKFRSLSETPSKPVPYTLQTDHITNRNFSPNRLQNTGNSILSKTILLKNTQSPTGWEPQRPNFTLNNCQSTSYDIINFSHKPYGVTRKATGINAKRSKGITEYTDLTGLYNPNFLKTHQQALQDEKTTFYKRKGIFTHMYDASHRHGNIIVPFEKQVDFGKPAFKV